jgi:hypothetical protein
LIQSTNEFNQTLEEALQSQIRWEWYLHEETFHDGEYNVETENLDGESLPHGLQIGYDGGPSLEVVEYFPHWHHEHAIELLEDSYEELVNYF